jgi:hypothetical protein
MPGIGALIALVGLGAVALLIVEPRIIRWLKKLRQEGKIQN